MQLNVNSTLKGVIHIQLFCSCNFFLPVKPAAIHIQPLSRLHLKISELTLTYYLFYLKFFYILQIIFSLLKNIELLISGYFFPQTVCHTYSWIAD